ncbi:hypothetical protein KFE25_006654 [Diacronema lutheri]|uniref:Uncharacterized protein n=1 Tax=Diacronema lutheri TaxID=2081491 RepID=A0A8J6CAG3_DIALT|nr:hypothetical protein KFE25_006654 [Diacronema lutheri]
MAGFLAASCLAATRLSLTPAHGAVVGRRHALEVVASVGLSALAGSGLAWLEGPTGRLGVRAGGANADSPDGALRSVNELAEQLARERRREGAVRASPASLPTRADARAATERLLHSARELDRAMDLAADRRWDELSRLAQTVREDVERSVRVVMASELATAAMRAEIGWEWGNCGWRRCGIQADVVQTLCKLREGIGLFVPAEARLYVDAARRGLDELLRVLDGHGVLSRDESAWLSARTYLSKDDLDAVLGDDSVNGEAWAL